MDSSPSAKVTEDHQRTMRTLAITNRSWRFRRKSWRKLHKIPGGILGSIFAGYVPLASPDPYPIIVYSVANYRPHVSHFWANIPQIPTCRKLLTPDIPQMCDPILVTGGYLGQFLLGMCRWPLQTPTPL